MPQIGNMEELGNYEVLAWLRATKARHAAEDASAAADGLTLKPRPTAITNSLDKHEHHLTREIYPYDKNPSLYNPSTYDIDSVVTALNAAIVKRIHEPLLKEYQERARKGEMTVKEGEKALEKVLEGRGFSEMELMQLHNLAPKGMEALQLIVDSWEERFTEEEMETVLEVVREVLRPDEGS